MFPGIQVAADGARGCQHHTGLQAVAFGGFVNGDQTDPVLGAPGQGQRLLDRRGGKAVDAVNGQMRQAQGHVAFG